MARGKHAKSKARRDDDALTLQVAQLRAAIGRERTLRAEAEGRAADAATLSATADALRASNERAVQSAVTATLADIDVLEQALALTEPAVEALGQAWQRVADHLINLLGGGDIGLERLCAAVGVLGELNPLRSSAGHRLTAAQAQRVAVARGERREVTAKDHDPDSGLGALVHLLPPDVAANLESDDPAAVDRYRKAEKRVQNALPSARDVMSLYASHPPTWVRPVALNEGEPVWLGGAADGEADADAEVGAAHDDDGAGVDDAGLIPGNALPEPEHDRVIAYDADDRRSRVADPAALRAGYALLRRLGVADDLADRSTGPGTPPVVPSALHRVSTRTVADVLAATEATEAVRERLVAAAGRLPAPWSNRPAYPRPGDAAAIGYWYAQAARGEAVRHEAWHLDMALDMAEQTTDEGDAEFSDAAHDDLELATSPLPGADEDGDLDRSASTYRLLASAAADAVAFWLPPSQAASFLASEALGSDDLDELRLPYPAVLVVPADPVRLDGTHQPDPELTSRLVQLDAGLRKLGRTSQALWPALCSFSPDLLTRPPSREELLAVRGADVEAVLLLADDAGRLADQFAWCLAIPGAGSTPAVRLIVPARRSFSAYAAEVGNLAAVAAWADWHDTEQMDVLPARGKTASPTQAAAAARGAGTGVRILDVKRTGGGLRSETVTGKTVAPHLRRGHWRRQHYGPRNSLVRRVRIGPILVNAGAGDLLPQIYRLPGE